MTINANTMLSNKRVLIVSPHPDDETLGCGGMMAKAKTLGSTIAVLLISTPKILRQFGSSRSEIAGVTRMSEFADAMQVLGVTEWDVLFENSDHHMRLDAVPQINLVGLIEDQSRLSLNRFRPDVLCFPAFSYNQDHQAVFRAVLAACRPHLRMHKHFVPIVMAYDQPQLSWNNESFRPNLHVDISGFLERKLAAYAKFTSQLRPDPHHASLENVERLARLRGSEVSVEAAEAFHAYRIVI